MHCMYRSKYMKVYLGIVNGESKETELKTESVVVGGNNNKMSGELLNGQITGVHKERVNFKCDK